MYGTLARTIAAVFLLTSNAIALNNEVMEMPCGYAFQGSAEFTNIAFMFRAILETAGLLALLWVPLGNEPLPRSTYALVGGSYAKPPPV